MRFQHHPTAWVYRLFDEKGRLLYVGMSVRSVNRRLGAHLMKPWGDDVRRCVVTNHISAAQAREEEAHAIRTEHPRWNVSGRDWGTFTERLQWSDAQWHEYLLVLQVAAGGNPKYSAPYQVAVSEYRVCHPKPPRQFRGPSQGNRWHPGVVLEFVGPEII